MCADICIVMLLAQIGRPLLYQISVLTFAPPREIRMLRGRRPAYSNNKQQQQQQQQQSNKQQRRK